jgi:hypothetical protein
MVPVCDFEISVRPSSVEVRYLHERMRGRTSFYLRCEADDNNPNYGVGRERTLVEAEILAVPQGEPYG